MAALKLYLILIDIDGFHEVRTYSDFDMIQEDWSNLNLENKIGIIHSGFVRPILEGHIRVPKPLTGKILYSGALKWALPENYNCTNESVADISLNDRLTPCYLAVDHWGYGKEDFHKPESLLFDLLSQGDARRKETISLAAQQVLIDTNNKPMSKEEIYGRIIESDYYQFNTQSPVRVLDITLSRESLGTEYSKAAKKPVFGKTKDGYYYLLADSPAKPKDWVYTLSYANPQLYEKIRECGIYSDENYLAMRDHLPEKLCAVVDNQRFELLLQSINPHDLYELLRIAPKWLLARDINEIGFAVRPKNALLSVGISKLNELAELKMSDLYLLPNMGRRSINDMCSSIITKVRNIGVNDGALSSIMNSTDNLIEQAISESGSVPLIDQIVRVSLRQHLDRTLEDLDEVDRVVLHGRLGYRGKVLTLEELAEKLDVTRERVRQRQKRYVDRIIAKEYWDDVIGVRIGQLLLDREDPLILEMLEIEDLWFEGFTENYTYLANVIQMFSENAIHVIEAEGRNVITRISQKGWDGLVKEIKYSLKQKADQDHWSRADVNQYCESALSQYSAQELLPLLQEMLTVYLQFDGEGENSTLVAYGKSAESAVIAVLAQAEGPLHFSEIAKRASQLLGKTIDERRAHNAVTARGVWLYDRGTYGLIDHCPLPETKRKYICHLVEQILLQGPINKQWHSKEIIEYLGESNQDIPSELDPYVLRMCIEGSKKINFLNRMVWARADSGLSAEDRIDVSEAFIQILEAAGEPLSGKELKRRLSEIRGVDENMQIHPNDRLVAVGPNVWGLSEWQY